jgi:twitching motility protein PilU
LKNTLRQAPDVILIGEIRDQATMDYAIAFAETGHLCLATLHANNSNQALDRIINFFPSERREQLLMDLSLNIKGVVSQRLIPKKGGGRAAAIEILLASPLVSDLIHKGAVHELKPIMAKSRDLGMCSFDQALFDLCAAGLVEPHVAMRYADSQNELRIKLKDLARQGGIKDLDEGESTLSIVHE